MEKKSDNQKDKEVKTESKNNFTIVGVGASAGGLEALERFFSNTKPNMGMAFVVVQHLSPDYKSLMVELLSKHTEMDVLRAEDGMLVEQNKVYLIPPKKNMTIFHGKLLLTEQIHSSAVNLPIDIFFRSLAEDFGEKAVGVILSGTGSDGTLGIRAIKGAGGLIIVQDEKSAKFDGMPRSALSTGLVDFVLTPEEMGDKLLSYSQHPMLAYESNKSNYKYEDHFSKILSLIRSSVGVDFTYYKTNTILRRIERRIGVNQLNDIEDYTRVLIDNENEVLTLYKELLIGVTKFFRDTEAFTILKEKVIPDLLKKTDKHEQVRVWVAGCSTGEEAYSFAILFKEYMEENNILKDVKIFATDIDKEAIEFASAGVYPESIVADVSEDFLKSYFVKNNNSFRVNESIRQMVIFATHNIIKDPPFSKMDFISCRNLLIYLEPLMQKKVLSAFSFSLNKGGYLFLGTSESIGDLTEYFETFDSKWKYFISLDRNKKELMDDFYVPSVKKETLTVQKDKSVFKIKTGEESFDYVYQNLINQYVPSSVLIDKKYSIAHVFNDVNEYIKFPSGKLNLNILNMVHPDLSVPLGTAIHRVFKERKEIDYNNLNYTVNGKINTVNIKVIPIKSEDFKASEDYLLIIFDKRVETIYDDGEMIELDDNASQRLEDLENELKFNKENLQATIEELETSNEELQATNEELIASNEELQSTNEELQSVNEELYTVNSEYQNKIEELTELNNDINNWFKTTNIGTIFLDLKLRVRKFTPAIEKYVNLIEKDLGRPFKHISYNFEYKDFFKRIDDVLTTLQTNEIELQTNKNKWFLLKILPYRTVENAVKGIVITFIDINQRKEFEEQIKRERDLLIRILQNSPTGKIMLNRGGVITFVNKKTQEIFGMKEEELLNRKYNDSHWKIKDLEGNPIPNEKSAFRIIIDKCVPIYNYAETIEKPDGNRITISINGAPIVDNEGKADGAVFSITEKRK